MKKNWGSKISWHTPFKETTQISNPPHSSVKSKQISQRGMECSQPALHPVQFYTFKHSTKLLKTDKYTNYFQDVLYIVQYCWQFVLQILPQELLVWGFRLLKQNHKESVYLYSAYSACKWEEGGGWGLTWSTHHSPKENLWLLGTLLTAQFKGTVSQDFSPFFGF